MTTESIDLKHIDECTDLIWKQIFEVNENIEKLTHIRNQLRGLMENITHLNDSIRNEFKFDEEN